MNEDVLAGQWQQMRGELKLWWSKLADDDLDRLGDQKDKLVGLLQEAYGYTRNYAAQEVEWRLKEFSANTVGAVTHITANGHDLDASAANKANDAASVVGEKLGPTANVIRENAPADGAVVSAATAVGAGLASASSYLHEKKFDHVTKDVSALLRAYPVQSLLIGVGLGFLLARRPR